MLLYDNPFSGNCYKVRLLCAQLGLEYDRIEVDVVDRSNPRDELAPINPAKGLPTLVLDDDRVLAESGSILQYLADGTPLLPADRYERALVTQWLLFEQHDLEPPLDVARFLLRFMGESAPERMLSSKQRGAVRGLETLETGLADGRDWLVGDAYSIADIAVYGYVHLAPESGVELAPYPSIRAWTTRLESQPGYIPIGA